MLRRISDKKGNFEWADLVDPSSEELAEVITKFGLPAEMVNACLDPAHLPLFEELENAHFILIRYADLGTYAFKESDTIIELTRKISLFAGPKFLVSIHRKEQPFLSTIFENAGKREINNPYRLLSDLFHGVLTSYEKPLAFVEDLFETFEKNIFDGKSKPDLIKDLYFLKRKIAVYKRMIRLTMDVIFKMVLKDAPKAELRHIREEADRMYFFSNELEEDINNLLVTHLSLSSNRTNDIVRVLTLFSVFFMPLTFIVGVYGMNFKVLPELEWRWGYLAVWLVMLTTCGVIFAWFRKKDWLK